MQGTPGLIRRLAPTATGLVLLLALLSVIWQQRTRILYRADSPYGTVRVTERSDGLRSLYTGEGRARQSALYPERPRHLELAYTRVAMLGLALIPADGRILFVGLGGGAMPTYAHAVLPEARIDVVEIDPEIVHVAQRFFGFRRDRRMAVYTGDGRAFIEAAPHGRYHLIVLDAFSDDEVPFALTTRQFLTAVRSRLAPGGVVISNLWSGNPAYASMLATYRAVFPDVHLVRVPRRAQRILVAGRGDRALDAEALERAARRLARRARLEFDLPGLVQQGYEGRPAGGGAVLEDGGGEM